MAAKAHTDFLINCLEKTTSIFLEGLAFVHSRAMPKSLHPTHMENKMRCSRTWLPHSLTGLICLETSVWKVLVHLVLLSATMKEQDLSIKLH